MSGVKRQYVITGSQLPFDMPNCSSRRRPGEENEDIRYNDIRNDFRNVLVRVNGFDLDWHALCRDFGPLHLPIKSNKMPSMASNILIGTWISFPWARVIPLFIEVVRSGRAGALTCCVNRVFVFHTHDVLFPGR